MMSFKKIIFSFFILSIIGFYHSTLAISTKFVINDNVRTTTVLNVRSTPSSTGVLLGAQPVNATGKVVDGPIQTGTLNWWKIDYTNGKDGWSSETFLNRSLTTEVGLCSLKTHLVSRKPTCISLKSFHPEIIPNIRFVKN